MYIFKFELFWITLWPTYYWLMYVLWFMFSYILIKKNLKLSYRKIEDLFIYSVLWVVLWWRLIYMLFYWFADLVNNPLNILKIWEWWMSFHWWVVWIILAMYFFNKKYKIGFLKLADELCFTLPVGLFLWRIWNYINKELLWYYPYDWPFAVYINSIWHFPSPLIEALLEGIVLFIILYYARKYKKNNKKFIDFKFKKSLLNYLLPKSDWQIAALFLIFYALFRIFVEVFFRLPDEHIGYIFWFFTMWIFLTIPMLLIWLYYFIKLSK